jgi:hypothetical protein
MESDRNSELWFKAVSTKQDLYEQLVEIEIPILKRKLKEEFQNRYHLLDK